VLIGAATTDTGEEPAPAAGEEDGFVAWYERKYGRVVGVLMRLGSDQETARDLSSEAFARALERWDRVGRMVSPTGWTFQVALNLQRRSARRARLERLHLARQHAPDPTRPVEGEVWHIVRALPSRQRQAVVLHYVADLAYADVARLMGVTEGTVAATLAAARRRLAGVLRENGEGRTGG